MPQPKYTKHE
jgi:hypothetical protein